MVLSDYFFVSEFLNRGSLATLASEEYEKTRSSQLKAHYSSREVQDKLELGFQLEIQLNPRLLRKLSSKEKTMMYLILRLLKIYRGKLWSALFLDYQSFLNQINFDCCEEYFYYKQLEDNFFIYELDCLLWKQNTRRVIYRRCNSQVAKTSKSLFEYIDFLIEKYVDLQPKLPKKPKRLIRHKGYRDHGSLGSEVSRTLRDQRDDWSLREKEEKRRKDKNDYIALLRGIAGLE